jgi:hypothetical protein
MPKAFLQGLEPVESRQFTWELKLRTSKESTFSSKAGRSVVPPTLLPLLAGESELDDSAHS